MKNTTLLLLILFAIQTSFGQHKTPRIVIAASKGKISDVKTYIKRGDDINATSRTHWSALAYAVNKNNYKLTELLLEKGADVNSRINTKETVLLLAAKYSYTQIAILLLEHHANVEAKDIIEFRAMHWAAKSNNKELIIKLLEFGANINAKNVQGRTPLDMANPNIKKFLQSKGAKTGKELIENN